MGDALAARRQSKAVMILLPFAVEGSLVLRIARQLRARGEPVRCVIEQRETGSYRRDDLSDFAATDDLLDLSRHASEAWRSVLRETIQARSVAALIQVGAFRLYPLLGFLKQDLPDLRVADLLYNPVGHVVRHFLYEGAFDRVFVESNYMRGVMQASARYLDRPVDVLLSGIDLSAFTPAETPPRPLTLGFVGRFSEEKGPLEFVALAHALAKAGSDACFAVFGSGPMEGAVRSACQAGPAADRIAFHGYVADVRDAFAAVDVLVLASKADGRPVAVMEAAACGVPVIGAPVGAIPEMIEDGVNGWIAKPGEVGRILDLIAMLQGDPTKLAKMRASARAHAERHFGEGLMLNAYADAFRRLSGLEGPSERPELVTERHRRAAETFAISRIGSAAATRPGAIKS